MKSFPVEALLLCAAVMARWLARTLGGATRKPAPTAVVVPPEPCAPLIPATEPEGPAICHRPIGINGRLYVVELSKEQHATLCDLATIQMALAFACSRDRRPYVNAWEA